jgi:chaperonin GroES
MKIRPLSDNIVVEPVTETKTPGGILLPDSAQKKTGRGRVLAVGPGKARPSPTGNGVYRELVDVAPGQVVVFAQYAGHEEEVGGKKVRILQEADVLGVVED